MAGRSCCSFPNKPKRISKYKSIWRNNGTSCEININNDLINDAIPKFVYLFVELKESNDACDTAQLPVLLYDVNSMSDVIPITFSGSYEKNS
jgi:hypothetical protein